MGVQDLIITPIYFFLFLVAAYLIRPLVTTNKTRHYFIPGLMAKFAGAITIGLIYQFYYSWGDTYTFFREARIIWSIFLQSPIDGLRIIFQDTGELDDLFFQTSRLWTFKSPNNFAMIRILSFINLFTFNTYSAVALIFAGFSFSGSWAFYTVLNRKFNTSAKHLAVAIFFIPSVVIWGSGIFKDTLTFGALMWLMWALFKFVEYKKISVLQVIVITTMVALIASIKVYILICFLPMVVFWFFFKRIAEVKNKYLKLLSIPVFAVFALLFGYLSALQAGSLEEKYALQNLAKTAQVTAYDIAYFSGAGGSTYTLGSLDGTWTSMLILAPQAINVSLFRPYPWEVSNPLMLLSALESLAFFFLTLKVLFSKAQIGKTLTNPFALFCLGFSVIFAFAVGVSAYNFGTLVRYKIPLLPFYALFLTIGLIKTKHELR